MLIVAQLERNSLATNTLLTKTPLESNMTHFTCHSSAVTAGRPVIHLSVSRWHDWLLTVGTSLWRKKKKHKIWLNVSRGRWHKWMANNVQHFQNYILFCLLTSHTDSCLLFFRKNDSSAGLGSVNLYIVPSSAVLSCKWFLISLLLLLKE